MARLDKRKQDGPNALVASAEVLTGSRIDPPQVLDWQLRGWHFYGSVGEYRRGIDWIAQAASRCRLIAAERPEGVNDSPVPVESGVAVQAMAEFAGGIGGQSALIAAAAVQLGVVGEVFIVGYIDPKLNLRVWEAHSADEIRARGTDDFELRRGDNRWDNLGEDSHVIRIWRADRRFAWRADSTTRTLLPILREVELSTEYIQSALVSRLAGAGLLVIPNEIVFKGSPRGPEEKGDPFVLDLIDAMITPIKDSNSASRHVPLVIKVPGQWVDKVKHIRFAAPFDEKAIDQRDNAITRLARSMDLETEQLTGMGEVNHWGQWEIRESTMKITIAPLVEAICYGLTLGYLAPILGTAGEAPDNDIIVWYDSTELDVKPDLSEHTERAYDRGEASGVAYRREIGLSEDDKPSLSDLQDWAIKQMVKDPTLAPVALDWLKINAQALPQAPDPAAIDAPSEEEPPGGDGPPPEPSAPPPGSPPDTAAMALLEACDGLVDRALERAGNRLRQVAKIAKIACRAQDAHCAIDPATLHIREGYLFDGAWDRAPQIAARYGIDSVRLVKALAAYCDTLYDERKPHHVMLLADFLRTEPWLTPNG
jgi:hypothetical protein